MTHINPQLWIRLGHECILYVGMNAIEPESVLLASHSHRFWIAWVCVRVYVCVCVCRLGQAADMVALQSNHSHMRSECHARICSVCLLVGGMVALDNRGMAPRAQSSIPIFSRYAFGSDLLDFSLSLYKDLAHDGGLVWHAENIIFRAVQWNS